MEKYWFEKKAVFTIFLNVETALFAAVVVIAAGLIRRKAFKGPMLGACQLFLMSERVCII